MKDLILFLSLFPPPKTNISAQKRSSTLLYRLWLLTSPFFKFQSGGSLMSLLDATVRMQLYGGGMANHNGTDLHIYFYPSPEHTRLLSFILVDVCVLGSSGWLAVYYSTPGALKVQGLAARKVTAGSPLNSCKLSAGFRSGGGGGWLMALGGSPARGSFCKYPHPPTHTPSLEGILFLDAGSGRGQRLYSYTAWPL